MTIKKYRSPIMTVIQTTSFSLPAAAGTWKTSTGKVYSPPINGELIQIITSFNSNDTDASLNVLVRDLASTNVCKVTDWSTNKAAATRFPQFLPHSMNTSSLINTVANCSGGIGFPLPVAGSLEFGVSAGTSADTCICEIYYRV